MVIKRFINPQALSSSLALLRTLQPQALGCLNRSVTLISASNLYVLLCQCILECAVAKEYPIAHIQCKCTDILRIRRHFSLINFTHISVLNTLVCIKIYSRIMSIVIVCTEFELLQKVLNANTGNLGSCHLQGSTVNFLGHQLTPRL